MRRFRQIGRIGSLLALGLALSGCAQIWTWDDLKSARTEKAAAKEPVPNVGKVDRRLARLEQELQAMRLELGLMNARMTEIVTQNAVAEAPAMPRAVAAIPASAPPAAPSAPKPLAVALPKPEPAKPAPAEPVAKDGSRYFSIHLASYRHQADAVRGWMSLKQRFGTSLRSLEPRLARTQLGSKGEFLRLKAGPFETWSAANEACEGLRQSGWICTVMDFSGDTLEGV